LNNNLLHVFHSRWVEFVVRLLLGATFIFASYHKILAPAEFAKLVYGYNLFPGELINLIAIILPFVELIAGLSLILGFYPRSAAMIIMAMLLLFILILSINIARGYEIDCGCFSVNKLFPAESPWVTIARDIVLFFLGVYVVSFKKDRNRVLTLTKE
jgi:uncharacterized membrane protein YphA (DoxX/SURF4 family)